jgi:hypothetical protein
MSSKIVPGLFLNLQSIGCISESDILNTDDGFWMVYKSVSDILATKDVREFVDTEGLKFDSDRFFDDWFLYAVRDGEGFVYSLLKMREQEFDANDTAPADGDLPGVTVSFISFSTDVLIECLADSTGGNRQKLDREINRVVALRGQRHHESIKIYFADPASDGAYLIAELYARHIASFAENGCINTPEHYKEIASKAGGRKVKERQARLVRFIESVNQTAGYVVCDGDRIYIQNAADLTEFERAVILATHTGNTSEYSFAAEIEYHARFLTAWARIKIPFIGKSIYASAIRADMTVGDTELQGHTPFYNENSKIVKRQSALHK